MNFTLFASAIQYAKTSTVVTACGCGDFPALFRTKFTRLRLSFVRGPFTMREKRFVASRRSASR